MASLQPYITLDGHNYAIAEDSYVRSWKRNYSATVSVLLSLQLMDKGPGYKQWNFTIRVASYAGNPLIGVAIPEAPQTAKSNLETSYSQVASKLVFIDPYGTSWNVFFVDLIERIQNVSTSSDPNSLWMDYDVMLIEAKNVI